VLLSSGTQTAWDTDEVADDRIAELSLEKVVAEVMDEASLLVIELDSLVVLELDSLIVLELTSELVVELASELKLDLEMVEELSDDSDRRADEEDKSTEAELSKTELVSELDDTTSDELEDWAADEEMLNAEALLDELRMMEELTTEEVPFKGALEKKDSMAVDVNELDLAELDALPLLLDAAPLDEDLLDWEFAMSERLLRVADELLKPESLVVELL
jgi:hypothetical protein